ncbi:hypothetical protein [Paenibacillus qinlingensis]|uniref:Uncharacterized protein n=1 Tax=Paenibacillus qinlingensis TaxID=1837343 RepID=A0ABU1P2C8_9BACL|nr:hypothetical protein [Paenibacillus qinlingensis]MDR6553222.1 hypothetical protein [Paenibacillus qinlingensis]
MKSPIYQKKEAQNHLAKQENMLRRNGTSSGDASHIHHLQRTIGNKAVTQMMRSDVIQRQPSETLLPGDVGQWFIVTLPFGSPNTKTGTYLGTDARGHWFRGHNINNREYHFCIIRGNVERTMDPGWGGHAGYGEEEMDLENEVDKRPTRPNLQTEDAMKSYAGHVKGVQSEWRAMNAETRAAKLVEGLLPMFASSGVPVPTLRVIPKGTAQNGNFDSTTWSAGISEDTLEKEPEKAASTMYHEARHGEQYFLIARYIHAQKLPEPPYKQIPDHVMSAAADANARSQLTEEENVAAQRFHTSIFGSGATERNNILKRTQIYTQQAYFSAAKMYLDANQHVETLRVEFRNLKEIFDKSQNEDDRQVAKLKQADLLLKKAELPALKIAAEEKKLQFERTLAEYKNLPEEADAFAVQAQVDQWLAK